MAITVTNVTTLKAISGLTIVSGSSQSVEKSLTGTYDSGNEVIQLNAVFAGSDATMKIELVDAESDEAIAKAVFKGKVVQ